MKKFALGASASALAVCWSLPAVGQTEDTSRRLPSIVVESQRIEENIQDVPISVTALDSELLELKQVDTFSDLQFNAPNVNYTKTGFSGSNFQIRGVGATLTAASADSGVATHVNDVYIQSPRLFELEYYDLERVELLRGPQGTLFGRNATGGTINMITAKPLLEEHAGALSVEYGNYDSLRIDGMVNIPLGEDVAVRLAGIKLQRSGFWETVDPRADFEDYDDRDIYSLRGSLRWTPTDDTTIDFMASTFDEDDSRVRTGKGLCDFDPTAVLGCTPTGLGFDSTNFSSTQGGLSMSNLVLGPYAAFPFNTIESNPNPSDFRQEFLDQKPTYRASEDFFMASLEHDFGSFTLNANYGVQETSVSSNQFAGSPIGAGEVVPSPLYAATLPINAGVFLQDDLIGVSALSADGSGIIGGNVFRFADGIFSYDQSDLDAEQTSYEIRLTSDLDGAFNFMLGYYNLEYENNAQYYIASNSLDYAAGLFPTVFSGFTPVDGVAAASPFFRSDTDLYELESQGIFGEAYWQATEDVKVTLGLRSTTDDKFLRARAHPVLGILDGVVVPVGPSAGPATAALIDTVTPYEETSVSFDNEITGRLVVDWQPDLSFTDDTLVYASYSRGFKSGGINPPVDPSIISGIPTAFEPEKIDAYEIGTKNTIGPVQANLSAFFYDYNGLQVGKIQARTSINENVDAEIWGLEGEFLWAPTDNWLFNMTASYLSTEVIEFESEDPRDLTGGQAGHIILKDQGTAENCLLLNADPTIYQSAIDLLAMSANPLVAIPASAATPLSDINGLESPGGIFSCRSALVDGALIPTMNMLGDLDVTSAPGVAFDLSGNELQNSPEYSINLGAQYTLPLDNGMSLTARTDYYYQDEMFASIYNTTEQDVVDAWDVWNAQVTLNAADDAWFVRGFIQNILDEDHITGQTTGGSGTGLATTAYLLDPQLYGLEVGIRW